MLSRRSVEGWGKPVSTASVVGPSTVDMDGPGIKVPRLVPGKRPPPLLIFPSTGAPCDRGVGHLPRRAGRVGSASGGAMSSTSTVIDPQALGHTLRLFDETRRVLPQGLLAGLTREVVARLAESAAARLEAARPRIGPDEVAAFCDLLLRPDQGQAALAFLAARRAEGTTPTEVYLGYIAAAARLLGTRWESDQLTPLQVTIGAGTLYALMRALRGAMVADRAPEPRRAALFATAPGERHGIGITVAADLFRQAGWEIDPQLGFDLEGLLDHAGQSQPEVIGLSLSTRARLPELVRAVLGLRLAVPGAMIGVAPGGNLGGRV